MPGPTPCARPDDGPIVRVDGFRMDFGPRTVVEDLSFDVRRGETFGFLGSNGSGKTTTIRALLGIARPTAGTLHVNGRPFRPEDGATLGYLPEERGLYRKEPVLDVMAYFGRLKGMGRSAARAWSQDYLERVGLAEKARVRLDRLSGGQQQKVQLGVTVMAGPELLILDEPTKGFDPVNRRLLLDIIAEQKAAGATVMMVTHQMEDVEQLCDRILLLKDGRAAAYGTVAEVQDRHGPRTARVEHDGALPASDLYRVLSAHPRDGGGAVSELELAGGATGAAIVAALVAAGVAVEGFTVSRTSLEEVFLRVYGAPTDITGAR